MQNTNFLDCSNDGFCTFKKSFQHTTDSFASRGFDLICISLSFLSKLFFCLRLDDGYPGDWYIVTEYPVANN
jgi:hypothetical protein